MLKSHFPTTAYSGLSMTRLIARRRLLVIQLTTVLLTQVGKKYKKKTRKLKRKLESCYMFKKLHLPLCNVSGMTKESDGLLQLGSYSQGFDLKCH